MSSGQPYSPDTPAGSPEQAEAAGASIARPAAFDRAAPEAPYLPLAEQILLALGRGRGSVLLTGDPVPSLLLTCQALRKAGAGRYAVVGVASGPDVVRAQLQHAATPPVITSIAGRTREAFPVDDASVGVAERPPLLFVLDDVERLGDEQLGEIYEMTLRGKRTVAGAVLLASSNFLARLQRPALKALRDDITAQFHLERAAARQTDPALVGLIRELDAIAGMLGDDGAPARRASIPLDRTVLREMLDELSYALELASRALETPLAASGRAIDNGREAPPAEPAVAATPAQSGEEPLPATATTPDETWTPAPITAAGSSPQTPLAEPRSIAEEPPPVEPATETVPSEETPASSPTESFDVLPTRPVAEPEPETTSAAPAPIVPAVVPPRARPAHSRRIGGWIIASVIIVIAGVALGAGASWLQRHPFTLPPQLSALIAPKPAPTAATVAVPEPAEPPQNPPQRAEVEVPIAPPAPKPVEKAPPASAVVAAIPTPPPAPAPAASPPATTPASQPVETPKPTAPAKPAETTKSAKPTETPKPASAPTATVARPSSPALSHLPPAEIAELIARGDSFLRAGDIVSARLFYERAAEGGDGQAALLAGETYDPRLLARARLRGVQGDRAKAAEWYGRAFALGAPGADALLKNLDAR